MKKLLGLLLFLLAAPLAAQVVTLPPALTGDPGIPIPVTAVADGKNVTWLSPDKLVIVDGAFFGGDSRKAILFGGAGTYRLWAFTAKGDTVSPKAECIVTIGPPVPPTPPTPTPPTPTPPTPVAGLRVLILYETAEMAKVSPEQQLILYGQPMRTYLSLKCMADPYRGYGRAWAIWDKDVDASAMGKAWQAMLASGQKLTMPALVIAGPDGTPVFAGALPASVDAAQTLINKYAQAPLRKAG